jgi:hypothetical protein
MGPAGTGQSRSRDPASTDSPGSQRSSARGRLSKSADVISLVGALVASITGLVSALSAFDEKPFTDAASILVAFLFTAAAAWLLSSRAQRAVGPSRH